MLLNDSRFTAMVMEAGRPSVVAFSANWCAPCRPVVDAIDRLAKRYGNRLVIGCIDIDDEPVLAERLAINSVPTVLMFQAGIEIDRIQGTPCEADLIAKVERLLLA